MPPRPAYNLLAYLLTITVILALTTVASALTYARGTASNPYATVTVVAIYNDVDEAVLSSHVFDINNVPDGEAFQVVGSLECIGESKVALTIVTEPNEISFMNVCGPTSSGTARSYILWLVSGQVSPFTEVSVP